MGLSNSTGRFASQTIKNTPNAPAIASHFTGRIGLATFAVSVFPGLRLGEFFP
jgi:hypothetical protein